MENSMTPRKLHSVRLPFIHKIFGNFSESHRKSVQKFLKLLVNKISYREGPVRYTVFTSKTLHKID